MKKAYHIMIALGLCLAANTGFSELRLSGKGISPKQSDDWSKAAGGELKAVFWGPNNIGFLLTVGVEKWTANEDLDGEGSYLGYGVSYAYAYGLEGEAQLVPFGAGSVMRIPVGERGAIEIEAGFKYVSVSSDVTWGEGEALRDAYGATVYDYNEYDVDIEDAILAYVDLDFRLELDEGFGLFAGVGIQGDMVKPEATLSGDGFTYETDFSGVYAFGGITLGL